MTSKSNLKRRLDGIATSTGGTDGPDEIVITDSLVRERGADPRPVRRTRIWRDDRGEWHSERTDL